MKKGGANFIGMYLIKVANMLVPLIYIPLASEYLQASERDHLFVILSVVTLCYIAVDFASPITGMQYFSENKETRNKSHLFYDILFFRLIVAIVTSIGAGFYIGEIYEKGHLIWFFLFLANTSAFALYSTWFALLNSKVIINSCLVFISRAIPILPIVLHGAEQAAVDFFSYISSSYFIISLVEFLRIKHFYKLKICSSVKPQNYVKSCHKTFIADGMPSLYNIIPTVIVPAVHGVSGFASFFVANRISNFVIQFAAIGTKAFMPTIGAEKKISFNILVIYFAFFFFLSLCFICFSQSLTEIVAEKSAYNSVYFTFLMLSAVPVSVVSFVNNIILIPAGKMSLYQKANIKGSLLFGCLSIIVVLFSGVQALAIMLCVSRVGLMFFVLFSAKKEIYGKVEWGRASKCRVPCD